MVDDEKFFDVDETRYYATSSEKNPLPSHSNFREDIVYRRLRNFVTSQDFKEILEIKQREDRKLRAKLGPKKPWTKKNIISSFYPTNILFSRSTAAAFPLAQRCQKCGYHCNYSTICWTTNPDVPFLTEPRRFVHSAYNSLVPIKNLNFRVPFWIIVTVKPDGTFLIKNSKLSFAWQEWFSLRLECGDVRSERCCNLMGGGQNLFLTNSNHSPIHVHQFVFVP